MDVEARQALKVGLDRAKRGDTESRRLLEEARKANLEFASNRSSAAAGRRASMAQQAYEYRMTATEGRIRAAYSMLAAEAGEQAQSIRAVANQVEDARKREVLIQKADAADQRRNVMMQAMAKTEEVFKRLPGLPAHLVGRPPSGQQVTVGWTNTFRSASEVERMSQFFPNDIRTAAGSFAGVGEQGLGWFAEVSTAINEDAKRAESQALEEAEKTAGQLPSTNGLAQQARALIEKLKQGWERHGRETTSPVVKQFHALPGIAQAGLAAGAVYLLYRLFR